MSEPWRPKKGDWIQVWDPSSYPSLPLHGKYGVIIRASKRQDEFVSDLGKVSNLSHITEGEVWKVLLTDGRVQHCNNHFLRECKKRPKASNNS